MTALQAAMTTLSASKTDPKVGNGKAAVAPNISTPAIFAQSSKKRKAKAGKLPVPPPKSTESVLSSSTHSVTLAELGNTKIGKANKASWDAIGKAKKPTDTAPLDPKPSDDDLDIPESLKAENRKPLTPEQQAKLDASKVAAEDKQNALREQIKAAKAEKSRGRVEKMLAKKSGTAASMPLTGKAAQDAIKRVTLIAPKPENGDSKIVADAVQNGKVHKVPAGKTYEQVMEDERTARRAEANKPTSKAPKGRAKASSKDGRSGTKLEMIVGLLTRKGGCTTAEVLAACDWPSVSMPQQAKAAGLKLRKEKVKGKPTRYFAA